MNSDDLQVFGHPLLLDVPEATADWIRQRWPVPCTRSGARPIAISRSEVGWNEQLESFDCFAFESTIKAQLTPDGFALRLDGTLLHAELGNDVFRITLSGDMQLAQTLLWAAMSEVIRLGGLLPFHAAAVANNGRCAVLMAPSKTGKSTTLVSAALAGYQPLAEDMLWIDPAALDVYGNDREIRLWTDSLERFGTQLPAATRRLSDGKFVVPLEALPGYQPGSCKLHKFVVLRRDLSQPSAWVSVPELELVRTLWESGCVPITIQARDLAQSGISALCRKVPYSGLQIGATSLDLTPLFA